MKTYKTGVVASVIASVSLKKRFSISHATEWLHLITACAARLPLLLLLALPATVQAQYNSTTNNGTITITGYTGSGGSVNIPGTIDGTPVTRIGTNAFFYQTNLTDITIPNGVTSIGEVAFWNCAGLTNVTIPNSVTNIEDAVFGNCTSLAAITVDLLNSAYSTVDGVLFNKSQNTLIQYPGGRTGSYMIPNSVTHIGTEAFVLCNKLTSVTIGKSVASIGTNAFLGCSSLTSVKLPTSLTSIEAGAFKYCSSLTSVTIPTSVTSIGKGAFTTCMSLTRVYFNGNAPNVDSYVFLGDFGLTVYYLAGTIGWGPTFDGLPTALWNPQAPTSDASFGVQTNQFGFNIAWANGMTIVVEACTNLANPTWSPLQTNTLSGDSFYFSDPQWTNHPARFYRFRSP